MHPFWNGDMKIIRDISSLRKYVKHFKLENKSIGFVPTMGALHEGHLELVRKSISQNDITVCSIFVNPTQFNDSKDFDKYPRQVDSDISKLERLSCNIVFLPASQELYSDDPLIKFDFDYLEGTMEGKHRPGHFNGVALVVTKLFNIVTPDKAYFGKKDLQQLTIIKRLTKELILDLEIVAVETIREKDGLAMSSRNSLLNDEERIKARDIYEVLNIAKNKLNDGKSVKAVKDFVENRFISKGNMRLEYFEIVETSTLKNVSKIDRNQNISLCIAGYLGNVRLIDNLSLN